MKRVVTISGVRLSDLAFYNWLLPEIKRRVEDWTLGQELIDGRIPNEAKIESAAKNLLQRLLSVKRGRFVVLSPRSWNYWKKTIMSYVRGCS